MQQQIGTILHAVTPHKEQEAPAFATSVFTDENAHVNDALIEELVDEVGQGPML